MIELYLYESCRHLLSSNNCNSEHLPRITYPVPLPASVHLRRLPRDPDHWQLDINPPAHDPHPEPPLAPNPDHQVPLARCRRRSRHCVRGRQLAEEDAVVMGGPLQGVQAEPELKGEVVGGREVEGGGVKVGAWGGKEP